MPGGLRGVLTDTAFFSTLQVLRRGLAMATLPVLARYLTASEFGALAVLTTVRELLSVAFQAGVPNTADRFYYDCRTAADRRLLFSTLFMLVMVTSIVGSALVLTVGPWLWSSLAPDIAFHPYVSLTVVTALLGGVTVLPRSIFRVTSRVPLFAALHLGQGALGAALSLALVVVWHLGVLGAVLGGLASAAVFFWSSASTFGRTSAGSSRLISPVDPSPSAPPTCRCAWRRGR